MPEETVTQAPATTPPSSGVTAGPKAPEEKPEIQGDPPDKQDFYKNKAIEFERKYNNVQRQVSELQHTVESLKTPKTEPAYTEDQLQAALSSGTLTPQQESYARTELQKIRELGRQKEREEILSEVDKRARAQITRQQAEQQVLSDPRFEEAFIRLPNGQVRWNEESELAQMIGSYMNDPRIKDQPDAISIASKLAYADKVAYESQAQATQLKRQNEQLKGATMIEGGGAPHTPSAPDGFREAMTRLKSGDKRAGVSAIKEYFRRRDA